MNNGVTVLIIMKFLGRNIVYAPQCLSDENMYAQWQYLKYQEKTNPNAPFLKEHITAYEKEMIRREKSIDVFVQKQMEKMR